MRNALVILAALVWMFAFSEAARAVPLSTATVALHRTTLVHASPGGKVVSAVSATTPLTRQQMVLPIVATRDVKHRAWAQVRLPGRPDGSTGWISTMSTTLSTTPWLVTVDRAQRKARIYLSGRLQRTYSVIVGRPSLPTPVGTFFVVEVFEDQGSVSGPYALATSAYSNVLQEFEGGPGQIALHGREGLPEALGTASSHGCVRFDNAAVTWLAWHLEAGTPIIIR